MTPEGIVLILGGVGGLITAIVTAIVSLRKIDTVKEALQGDVQAVHKIVNQQRTDMLAYQAVLVNALQAAGIHVPHDEATE